MTNEKTNPMPYRAADAAALLAAAGAASGPAGPDMAAPAITPDDVARGTELLRRYKDGKRAIEARIIADEQWYRLRHWQYLRDRRREQGADVVEPTSAWLFNAIVAKHADAMDSFPEAVILPRSEQDEPDAKALSAIVPAVLEKTHFEQVWSDAWWYKLKHGCAAYGVFWDSAGSNGLGDVAVRQLDLLNLFWEPGITDIQASRNLFVCALMDNDDISAAWPDARPGSCGVELAQYLYDDAVDTSNKSIVVDWYYKKPLSGGGAARRPCVRCHLRAAAQREDPRRGHDRSGADERLCAVSAPRGRAGLRRYAPPRGGNAADRARHDRTAQPHRPDA